MQHRCTQVENPGKGPLGFFPKKIWEAVKGLWKFVREVPPFEGFVACLLTSFVKILENCPILLSTFPLYAYLYHL
jgi:hypothetical protein